LGFNGDLTKKWGFHGNILWDVLGNTAGKDFRIGLTNQDSSKNIEYHCLVGGSPTPLKNISQMDFFPNIWKNKKCSKPPTSCYIWDISST